jgi:hypothetical protein
VNHTINRLFRLPVALLALALLLAGCAVETPTLPTATPAATETPLPTSTAEATLTVTPTETPEPTETQLPTQTPTQTHTPPPTDTPTQTLTPTITSTATPEPTATPDFPKVTVREQANCRYGPSTAYLYRWGLYPGEKAVVHARNWNGTWLWIKPENLDVHCWASEIVFDIEGDKMKVAVIQPNLPKTTFAGPPNNVQAVRDGNQVTVSWDTVVLSDDKRRGYLLEVTVCRNTVNVPLIVQSDATHYQFTDDENCASPSGGLLYTAEKHGYSDPVKIPWP